MDARDDTGSFGGELRQDTRQGQLSTPLGDDVLVLERFEGSEGLSELFEYRVDALSKDEVDYNKLLGESCTVTIESFESKKRHFNGIVAEAQWVGVRDEHHVSRLVLRPKLWLLTRTTHCRFFQEQSASQIIQKLLRDNGLDIEPRLQEHYPVLEYCVQYRETDFAFISRLMEHHGIYYFFLHRSGGHTLVLADSMSSHKEINELEGKVPFFPSGSKEARNCQHLYHWISERRFRTGKVQLNDYYELDSGADLRAKEQASPGYDAQSTELYDYPGKYRTQGDGRKYAKVVLDAEQALDGRRLAAGNAVSLYPGGLVTIEGHPHPKPSDDKKEYLVVRASHTFTVEQYRSGQGFVDEEYAGQFEFLPRAEGKVFRAPIVTPKPLIHGIQTAKVVGPSGEEINVDEHGRIKVKFFWQEEGDKNESCWIRVAEVWAGRNWGGQFIPRIGMEVVVEFLEGDPDRPLVTGTVYNDKLRHPYTPLPDEKTKSGVKSDSTVGSGGYNEFMFEDKKFNEEINMHAQKDHNVKVLHAESWDIGEKFEAPTGQPSRQVLIQKGDDQLKIASGSRNVDIKLMEQLKVGVNRDTDIGMMDKLKAGALVQIECGSSKITMTPFSIQIEAPLISLSGALIKIN